MDNVWGGTMIDFRPIKKLTIGGVELKQLFINGVQVWKGGYKNWVPHSTETDGVTIYNAPAGCMYGWRMNSSGEIREQTEANHTGYIPMTFGDVIRAKGSTGAVSSSGHYFTIYDETFTRLATTTLSNTTAASFYSATYTQQADGRYMLTIDTGKAGATALSNIQKAKYFRISFSKCKTEDFIVTVNEEIV